MRYNKNMEFFRVFLFISIFILTGLFHGNTIAQETSSQPNSEIENQIKEYEKKLTDLRQQKNTLASQIQTMDTQIYLTGLKIQESERQIIETEREIDTLTSRIESLDDSLTKISKLLLANISVGYKKQRISLINILLDSDNVGEIFNTIKYQKTAQNNNQRMLIQVQDAKSNYEEQKILRETKKKQLDLLVSNLANQKAELTNQQNQKQKLLNDTKNDEVLYQRLLSQAQQQLSSFKSFVQTSGGDSVIGANALGSGSDGNYYSQRDIRWANQSIGYSSESVLRVGCLLTSIAMTGKKYGQSITPSDIAADASRFWANTAWMNYPWPGVAGKRMVTVNDIDQELNSGNYVIVGVMINDCAYGGNHYVVLTKKEGDDYLMHDPIYGPDIKFKTHYSTICSSATFK